MGKVEAQPRLLHLFGASIAAELASKGLLHPMDTLKARLHYLSTVSSSQAVRSATTVPLVGDFALLRSPEIDVGVRSLYRGLAPALAGVVPMALVYMPTYELSKLALAGTPFSGLSGVITGCVCACVRVPISVVKSRVQLQLYDGPLAALRSTVGRHGVRGLYAGFGATLVHDVSYAAVQFALMEQLRLVADRMVGGRALTASEDAAVGFWVGLLTATVAQPLDLVRTRIMVQNAQQAAAFGYRGVRHGLASAVATDGPAALWRGLLPRLVLKSVGSSVWYSVYMGARRRLADG